MTFEEALKLCTPYPAMQISQNCPIKNLRHYTTQETNLCRWELGSGDRETGYVLVTKGYSRAYVKAEYPMYFIVYSGPSVVTAIWVKKERIPVPKGWVVLYP